MNRLLCLLVTGALCAAASTSAALPNYVVQDLGTLGGTGSLALGINDAGQVVGWISAPGGGHPFVTGPQGANPQQLPTPGPGFAAAAAINDAGRVAGWATTASGRLHAALWNGGSLTDLGTGWGMSTEPDRSAYAVAINARGEVAGWSQLGGDNYATVWDAAGTLAPASMLAGASYSVASGINDAGAFVGTSFVLGGPQLPTLWSSDGSPAVLTGLGGTDGSAFAINNAGTIVGMSRTASGAMHASLWSSGAASPLDLGTLGGQYSAANAINASGTVVGFYVLGNEQRAALWDKGSALDLNTLLSAQVSELGWVLQNGVGIDARGDIVGNAFNALKNEQHAFLVSAVPLPPPVFTLASTLVVLSATRRRKT